MEKIHDNAEQMSGNDTTPQHELDTWNQPRSEKVLRQFVTERLVKVDSREKTFVSDKANHKNDQTDFILAA